MMVRAWVLGSLVSWASWELVVVWMTPTWAEIWPFWPATARHLAGGAPAARGWGDPTATATPLQPLQPLQPDDGFWMAVRASGNVLGNALAAYWLAAPKPPSSG